MRKVLSQFVKQYSVRLFLCLAISITLSTAFINVYRIPNNPDCSTIFSISTNLQSGTVSQCPKQSQFSTFLENISPLISLAAIFVFVILLRNGIRAQVIHRRPWSWVRIFVYVYYGTLLAVALIENSLTVRLIILSAAVFVALVILAFFLYYRSKRQSLLADTFQYANGTIGQEGDVLGFSEAADNFRAGLLSLDLPVRVIGITGGMGEGKSTFWRFIAEGFEKDRTLHTYLSLTETNSTTDFSKLFAERWSKTLKSRYPFILSTDYTEQSRLYKILRDTGNGFIRLIANMLVGINAGLFRTRSQIVDASSETQNLSYVDNDVAKVFSNVPEVYEKQWYIVADELERAPITEVYRLIEIIERFKQLGKSGFPVQVVFVLCFDSSHFANFEDIMPPHDYPAETAKLVQDFLTNSNRKSVEIIRRIPNPSLDQRLELMLQKLKDMVPAEAFETDGNGNLKYRLLEGLYDPESERFLPIEPDAGLFEKKYPLKEVFDFILLRVVEQRSLRLSGRFVSQQLPFFMESFASKKEEWLLNTNLATFMGIEYINIVRPEFLPFIENSFIRFDPDLKDFYTAHKSVLREFKSKDEDDRTLREKILEHTGIDTELFSDKELERMMEELGVLVPVVGEFLTKGVDPYSNDVTQYRGTLSDPDNLKWIMAFSHGTRTNFGEMSEMFERVLDGVWPSDLTDPQKIVDFSGFTRNRIGYSDKRPEASLLIAKQIYIYMLNNRNIIKPSSIDMSRNPLDNLTYEFIFQIQEAVFGYRISEEIQKEGADLYDEFMNNPSIKYESKLIALDAFIKTSGSGLDRVQTREQVFDRYRGKDYAVKLFESMKKGIVEQYGKPRSPINIYNQESNIFYVQYQFWNGDVQDPFLDQLRKLANKGLTSNTNALITLWSVYPYESGWRSYNDLLKYSDPSPVNMTPSRRGMYVKLVDLVRFSKLNKGFRKLMSENPELKSKIEFWEAVSKDDQYLNEEASLQPANDTVGVGIRALVHHLSQAEK